MRTERSGLEARRLLARRIGLNGGKWATRLGLKSVMASGLAAEEDDDVTWSCDGG